MNDYSDDIYAQAAFYGFMGFICILICCLTTKIYIECRNDGGRYTFSRYCDLCCCCLSLCVPRQQNIDNENDNPNAGWAPLQQ